MGYWDRDEFAANSKLGGREKRVASRDPNSFRMVFRMIRSQTSLVEDRRFSEYRVLSFKDDSVPTLFKIRVACTSEAHA